MYIKECICWDCVHEYAASLSPVLPLQTLAGSVCGFVFHIVAIAEYSDFLTLEGNG